jgi:branched-chain amino acid aminotransferase
MSQAAVNDPAYVYLNGRLVPAADARVSVFDHGLLYGDGLFETLRVANGRCFRPETHLARLEAAAARLTLALPQSRAQFLNALQETANVNGLREGALRLTVTRGPGNPIPDPGVCPSATYFITARVAAPVLDGAFERGVRLCWGPQHPRLFVPGIKSLCYLPYQLARTAARISGGDDAILLWGDQVVETGISNLCLVLDGVLATPDLASGCLPGTTRALLLELALQSGIPVEERPISADELRAADEVFVTNSLAGVMPVRELAGEPKDPPGPVTRHLRAAYADLVERESR